MIYRHPPELVWQAVTSSDAMAAWLMPNDFAPIVGHRFTFRTKPAPGFDGVVQCEVKEVTPPSRLVFSWVGGGIDTLLTLQLAPVSEGTRLTLDHTGFRGLRGMMVSKILGAGWRSRILAERLPALLDRWDGTSPVPDLSSAPCH